MALVSTLIDNLAEACRRDRTGEKWLIAPTYRVAQQWLDRVTLAEGRVANVRVKTVASLALDLAGNQLAADGLALASAAQRQLAVAAAWARAVDASAEYLGTVPVTSRLLAVVERCLGDLRHAGLEPGDLTATAFEDRRKGRELTAVLAAYRAELEQRRLVDHADVLRMAVEPARSVRVSLLVPAGTQRSVLEARLLDAFDPSCVTTLEVDTPEAVRATPAPRDDLARLAWLAEPASAPAAAGDRTAAITHAVGEANEVRAVVRACLERSLPLDTVEIVYTATEPYVRLIYETAQRVLPPDDSLDIGVPITFAEGLPASITRPGRLLSAWLRWIASGFTQLDLLRIIQAGLLKLPEVQGQRASIGSLVRALRGLPIGFGRDRCLACIDAEVHDRRHKLDHPGRRDDDDDDDEDDRRERAERALASASALRALVAGVLECTPVKLDDARAMAAAAHALIESHAHCPSRLDQFARQHLLKELASMNDALEDAGAALPPGFDVHAWLEALPDQARAGGSGPRPGQLHVAPVRGGGHSGRPETFIVGLDDGRFPPAGLQDPLILDSERRNIGGDLPTSTSRLAEQIEGFVRLTCRLRGRVTLSFSSRDVADGRETFASPVTLAAYRILSGNREGDHGDLARWLGLPMSFAPDSAEQCIDTGEWWMAQGATLPRPGGLAAQLAREHPNLERGRVASVARASGEFTVYDGLIERPGADLDPRDPTGPVMSARQLQTLAKCPLQYFYHDVLRIRAPRDVRVKPGEWLAAPDFGTLLHDVLYDFVGELIGDELWPPDAARDRDRMRTIVQRRLDRARASNPPPSEAPYERQRDRLQRAAEIFLDTQPPGQPRYLEASFGLPPHGEGTAIDTRQPVTIDLSGNGGVRVCGRMDRIDAVGDGAPGFAIIDYKSGSYVKSCDPRDDFAQGRLVQHVVYMVAAQVVLRDAVDPGAAVERFTFFFPDARVHGRRVEFGLGIVPTGLQIIERLCTLAAGGVFIATDLFKDLEDCKFCNYKPACRSIDPDLKTLCRRSGIKKKDTRNTMLRPFVELRVGQS